MAYPRNHLRLVVSGTLYGTEQFSWGLALIPKTDPNAAPPDTVSDAVLNAVSAFHTQTSNAAARVTLLKLNEIGPNGKYTRATTVLRDLTTAPIAGTGTAVTPAQVSLAVTWHTDVTRGPASKGRIFIPVPALGTLDAGGRITTALRDAVRGHAETLVGSLNAALPGYAVGVASDVGLGALRTVRAVSVGRVPDTIRSRRTSLVEDRLVGANVTGYTAVTWGGGGGSF